MRRSRTLTALVGLATLGALSLAGCTSSTGTSADTASGAASAYPTLDTSSIQTQEDIAALVPDSVKSDGVLTVGADTTYAPAEFLDANGQPVGYDVDITRALAKVMGLEVQTVTAGFDAIIPAVGSTYDVGVSSFTVTPERLESVTMVSYLQVGSSWVVAKGNPDGIDPADPMNLCGLTVGVQTGTNQERAVSGYSQTCQDEGRSAIDTKSYTAQSDVTTNLAGGTVDIMFADSPVASYAVTQTDGAVEVVGDQVDAAPEAVVVAKDDEATAQAVQQALQYLMDHGYLAQILTSWGMGSDEALTTAEINPAV